jgi:hypothetical protein
LYICQCIWFLSQKEFFMKLNRSVMLAASVSLAMAFVFSCTVEEEDLLNSLRSNSLYCDYGPVNESGGGGCYEIAEASECNTQHGEIVSACGGNTPQVQPSSSSNNGVVLQPSSSSNVTVSCNGSDYLGRGYNVITSGYIRATSVKNSDILDRQKMCQDGIIEVVNLNNVQSFETSTGSSISKFYEDRNIKISAKLGGFASVFFSGNFGAEFSTSMSAASDEASQYSRVRSYRYTQDHRIKNVNAQSVSKYLTAGFISDLTNRTASQILDQYGTHVFVRYFKGGSLEANYKYKGSSQSLGSNVKGAVNANFANSFDVRIEGGSSNTTAITEANTEFSFFASGGRPLTSNTRLIKSDYDNWINSITNNADICGIPDDFNDGFIPIWELVRVAGYGVKATELENLFKSNAGNVKFPAAIMTVYKDPVTADNYKTSGSYSLTLNDIIPATDRAKATINEIEIYVLGAGGGGQGGDYNDGITDQFGTGGTGGGGQAAYLKLGNLNGENPATFSISVGKGGTGGRSITTGTFGTSTAGCDGGNGGATQVRFTYKGTAYTLTAGGGGGGNGNSTCKEGGGTGTNPGVAGTGGSLSPTSSNFTPSFNDGKSGTKGNYNEYSYDRNQPPTTKGGNSGKIDPSFPEFPYNSGQDNGGYYISLTQANYAKNGGGGFGGYDKYSGNDGGDGRVKIVIRYFTKE